VYRLTLFGLALSSCLLPPAAVKDDPAVGGHDATSSGASGSATGGNSATPQAGKTGSNAGSTSTSGAPSSGGTPSTGGAPPKGGTSSTANAGMSSQTGGSATAGSPSGGGGGASGDPCDAPNLTWKTGTKTVFESYPDPSSPQCVEFGCDWAGEFPFCPAKMSETWVSQHDIVAAFPSAGLEGHDLCLRSGNEKLVVRVLATCADEDCAGCCTANRGSADALIDVEKHTDERWGVQNSQIEWADLGPNAGACQ
jgi:hypothetical protein